VIGCSGACGDAGARLPDGLPAAGGVMVHFGLLEFSALVARWASGPGKAADSRLVGGLRPVLARRRLDPAPCHVVSVAVVCGQDDADRKC